LYLDAPRGGRGVDDGEQLSIDAIALGQELVEVHGAHHRANVGHHQIEDRQFHIGDLVSRLGGIQHLVEDDGVYSHDGVVASDHAL